MKYKGLPCAWCGDKYLDKAHVPTRFLVTKEERAKLKGQWPVLPACKNCNQELKLDEEWFAVHFASILYDASETAKKAFDGQITNHLKKNLPIAARYNKYLELINLEIDGQKMGLKTMVRLSKDDWKRLFKVAEMFARGLYYHHTGRTAKDLKSRVVYLNPARWEKLKKHMEGLKIAPLFPGIFEYAYGVTNETGEAAMFLFIYGKPSFFMTLVTEEREKQSNERVARGEIKPDGLQGIEILG